MQICTVPLGSEQTGFVFPPAIQSLEWVAFHGTSGAYSQQIERDGFQRGAALSRPDIEHVARLASRFEIHNAHAVSGFLQLGSISLSPSPLIALAYAQPGQAGGQGIGFVQDAAKCLLDQHFDSLDRGDADRLTRIVEWVASVRTHPPVIYAVDVQGLKLARYQSMTAAIHVFEDIPAGRILARATVPAGIDHAAINLRPLRDEIRTSYTRRGTHWICQVPV